MSEKPVKISSKWYDIITKRLQDSNEFQTVGEYVNFVLSEIFEEDEERYSEEEKAEIEKNLKDLGYI